ncbi:PilX N-terminal domain-containing pilus assembly protein [Curvibacter sp. APW13]|uniref:pilus assembly PilX family protein n=1 Tax=Curvibacter sp. APW13 TaxID=3077236 RepID=UPI0028DFCA14|nr:PilX N-terminal domain-containing pilus assembly protein [Curvibacter sp. APW13]MDT8991411.1 PilX N-terminal domain-containing pilus assembly protein [Curvibacter sp. APW13]
MTKHGQQKGVALIVGLIILAVMMLLGVSVIRNVTTEERMAGNSYSRSISFQAADAALREIELKVEANKPTISASCNTVSTVMVCAAPAATDTPRWLDSSFASWANATAVTSGSISVTPQYFVEYLGNTFTCDPSDSSATNECKRYRITTRVQSSNGQSPVMLQSLYATD